MLIENFRPGLMSEFGLALDDLRRSHTSPDHLLPDGVRRGGARERPSRPGYDIIVQALSGLMSVTGEPDGEPVKVGVALLDVVTGLQVAIGILAALHERARTGRGRHISVSLFDAGVAAMVNQAANHLLGGVVARPMGTAHPNICPYQAFHALGSSVHRGGRATTGCSGGRARSSGIRSGRRSPASRRTRIGCGIETS